MPIFDENGDDLTDLIVGLGYDEEVMTQAQQVRLLALTDREEEWRHAAPSHDLYIGDLAVRINAEGTTEVVRLSQCEGSVLKMLQTVVDGLIEPIDVSLNGIPEEHNNYRRSDSRRLELTMWVNENFVYQQDENGDLMPINPWAMKLLEKGGVESLPRGDVIVTSGHVDDDGNTQGLDWRAATAVCTLVACSHAYIGDGETIDNSNVYDCREYKITPRQPNGFQSDNFHEVFKVTTWTPEVTDDDLIALLEGE